MIKNQPFFSIKSGDVLAQYYPTRNNAIFELMLHVSGGDTEDYNMVYVGSLGIELQKGMGLLYMAWHEQQHNKPIEQAMSEWVDWCIEHKEK